MISQELKQFLPIIQMLGKIRGAKLRKQILLDHYKRDPKIYKAVKEIVTNLVHKNIPIDTNIKRKLVRHKRSIIELIHDNNRKRNRKHLAQSGGYLQYIIPVLTQILSRLLSNNGAS